MISWVTLLIDIVPPLICSRHALVRCRPGLSAPIKIGLWGPPSDRAYARFGSEDVRIAALEGPHSSNWNQRHRVVALECPPISSAAALEGPQSSIMNSNAPITVVLQSSNSTSACPACTQMVL